jgi:hypothetical protein
MCPEKKSGKFNQLRLMAMNYISDRRVERECLLNGKDRELLIVKHHGITSC